MLNPPIDIYRKQLRIEITNELNLNQSRLVVYFLAFTLYYLCLSYISKASSYSFQLFLVSIFTAYLVSLFAFLGHELHHGSIIQNIYGRKLLGLIGGIPLLISPCFWIAWHNNLHHKFTQFPYRDPDMLHTYKSYSQSKFLRFFINFYPNKNSFFSYIYFLFAFTFQSWSQQFYWRFKNTDYDKSLNTKINFELIFQITILAGLIYSSANSIKIILFGFIIPLLVANCILMLFISTNHGLSKTTYFDDPFNNSLSVTNSKLIELLTLNFGYHVEHHLFPNASGSNLPKIKKIIIKNFPSQYKCLNHSKALKLILEYPKVYLNSDQLISPKNGKTFNCI